MMRDRYNTRGRRPAGPTIKPPPKVDSKAARDNLKKQLQDFEVRGDKRQEQAEADEKRKSKRVNARLIAKRRATLSEACGQA